MATHDVLPELPSTLTQSSKQFPHAACYLPSTTVQVHASNLLRLSNGDILCAWFGGSQEGKSDISIWVSRLASGSSSWAKAEKVTDDPMRSEQNPVLFETPQQEVWLLHTSQRAGDQDSAVVKRRVSTDDGRSWSASDVLIDAPGTFIRQPIRVLPDGRWILPTFKCRTEPGTRWVGNDDVSAVRISSNEGATWNEVEVPGSIGCVHMGVQALKDGGYLAMYRSRWADRVYASTSSDGVSWAEPWPTDLPNPNAGIAFDVLQSGRILLVYNHSSRADATARREGLYDDVAEKDDVRENQTAKHGKEAFWGAPRAPLCLAWSDDGGKMWRHRVIEEGDGFCLTNNSEMKLNRELSYPSMLADMDGTVHVAFTFWRQKIKYIQFKADDITL